MPNSDCSIPIPIKQYYTQSVVATALPEMRIYHSIQEISPYVWEQLAPSSKMLLSIDYLKAFENSLSANVEFRYIVFSMNGSPIGFAIFQILRFDGANIGLEEGAENASWSKRMLTKLVNRFSMCILVCGNAFMTGEYGIHFLNTVSADEKFRFLDFGIQQIIKAQRKVRPISAVVLKDFFVGHEQAVKPFVEKGYLEFKVQPDMILPIHAEWKTFDGYLNAMTSKYRVRARKAIKMAADIIVREMSLEDIEMAMPLMDNLYHQIIDRSSFKLATFDLRHIPALKAAFPDRLVCLGFYLNGQLCAFISLYEQPDGEMIAGMLGMDRSLQKSHDLYLNILYTVAKTAIEKGANKVVMGRTAMEIKSSLGAEPHDMYVYARHVSNWKNVLLRPIMRRLTETKPWHQRTPFKD
ncbi:MAG: hypothetical protein SFW35_00640 [Chitinophagales bacterium]|nr:hypothetical protein [Chitinophagales bacterium]